MNIKNETGQSSSFTEGRQWRAIIIVSCLTALGASFVKDFVPYVWSNFISYRFEEHSLTVSIKNTSAEKYGSKLRLSVVEPEKNNVIDAKGVSIGSWTRLEGFTSSGVYVLEGRYAEGQSQLVYSKPLNVTGHVSMEVAFPGGWTRANTAISELGVEYKGDVDQPTGNVPNWIEIANKELEMNVDENTPLGKLRIAEYFASTNLEVDPTKNDWSAAFLNWVLVQAGIDNTLNSPRNFDWASFGKPIPEPKIGAIAIFAPFRPGSSGHVGFVVGSDDASVLVLGGNQSDRVRVNRYPISRIQTFRWPNS